MRTNNSILIIFFLFTSFIFGQNNSGENAELYKRARSLEQAGLVEETINLYEQLIKNDPKNNQYFNTYKRFLKNTGNQEKISNLAYNYYQYNKKDPSAYYEWIHALIMNQDENWKSEVDIFIDRHFKNKNLMRQILYAMYSSGLSNQLKPIIERIRALTKTPSFLSRELGDINFMRMDYQSGIIEFLLYLDKNPNDFSYISDKLMAVPAEDYILNIIRNTLNKNESNHSQLLLSNIEFREKNYTLAWEILKSQINSDELQIQMGNDLLENKEYEFAEIIFREILNSTVDKKIIEKCIFNIGRALELKSIQNANKLSISGFFKGNPFFISPFISINNDNNSLANAVSIFDSLSQNANSKNDAKFRLAEIKFRALGDLDGANTIFENIFKSSIKSKVKRNCILRMIEIDIAKGNLASAKNKITQFSNLFKKNNEKIDLNMKYAQILMFEGAKDSLNNFLKNSMKLMKSTDKNFNDILDILSLNLTFQTSEDLYSDFGKAQFLIQQNKRQEAIYTLDGMGKIENTLLDELIQYQIIYLYLMQKEYNLAIELATLLNGKTIYSELAFILQCEIADYIQHDYRLAVDLYLEFLENYPDSIYYDNIRLRLRELAS
tara:strand:- start:1647 stop:3473 length:1827 start_codon:yes stop_codon:yes gene_type:complete